MSAETTIDKMISLFDDHSEYFGLADADCPGMIPQIKQCEFEDKFKELICDYLGHDIGPDYCGKPEHDYCSRCRKLRTQIEAEAVKP